MPTAEQEYAAGVQENSAVCPVRVVVADDHELTRCGIIAVLESSQRFQVVAEADTGESAVEACRTHQPDILTLDFSMPDAMDGLAVAKLLKKEMPRVRVLVISMHATVQLVRQFLHEGARGYLLKTDASRDLSSAIDTVVQNKLYFTRAIMDILLENFLDDQPALSTDTILTPREVEIAQLLARGSANKEVASALNISLRTVETHRANIMNKLQLHSIQDLVRYAVRNKLVDA